MSATEPVGAWSRPAAESPAVIPPVVSVPAAAPNPNAAQAAMPLPTAQAVPQGATQGTLPEGMFGALPNEESRVLVRARGETWIQVRDRASGTVVFNRTLKPGEAYRAPMKPGLVLTMGNAPGTDVLVDGAVVPNPFPAVSVRRDIALEPDRVREGLAAAPVVVRAPATPAAPASPATQGAPTPPFTWAN
jgi:cytoskeleton protein RodZ